MPCVSFFMVRTALVQFGVGATLGALLLIEKGLHIFPWMWVWRPGHIQIMLLGWTIQLACGVAVWILPRLDTAGGRGDLRLAWLCYVALNCGVILVALHAPLANLADPARLGWMLPLAALLQVSAIGAIALHAWRRVLPFGVQASTS